MVEQDTPPAAELEADDGCEWAVVEVMGHRRHVGRIREEERFGAKMIRVDVPVGGDPDNGWQTHFYNGSALFGVTPCTREAALKANRPYDPPGRLGLPRPEADRFLDEINDQSFDGFGEGE